MKSHLICQHPQYSPYPELRIKTPPPDDFSENEESPPTLIRGKHNTNNDQKWCGKLSVVIIAILGILGILKEHIGWPLSVVDICIILLFSMVVYCMAMISVAIYDQPEYQQKYFENTNV